LRRYGIHEALWSGGRAAVVRLSDTSLAVAVTGSKLLAGVNLLPPRSYGLSFAAAEFQGLQTVESPGSCFSLPLSGSGAPGDAAADADGRGTASMGRRGAGARGLDGGIRPAQQVHGRYSYSDCHTMRDAYGSVAYGFIPFRHADPLSNLTSKHGTDEHVLIDDLQFQTKAALHIARSIGSQDS
jgi:hypothetical protein